MSRIKNIFNKYKIYFIYLFIIIFLLLCISLFGQLYPFGNNTLVKMDLSSQYYQYLTEIYNRVYNGNSLIYSFNAGIGLPLYRNFFNYLCSPFNLIYLLSNNHILSIHLIIYFKIIAIGFTMLFYLKKKFKIDNILLIIPTLCYALSGWVDAFYLNIMWLDGLIVLPLITLGIEEFINHKKYKLYIFTLVYSLITNYYISYMICFYILIYFLIYNVYKIKKEGTLKYKINELSRNLVYFGITTIIAFLISAIVLLPLIKCFSSMSAKVNEPKRTYPYNIVDYFAASLGNSIASEIATNPDQAKAPNIYAGLISIVLFIPFVFNKKVEKSAKIVYTLLFGIFLLFMCSVYLDYVINIFHVTAGFPFRYSFIYIFILSIITTYELLNIKEFNIKQAIISFVLITIMIITVCLIDTTKSTASRALCNFIFLIPIIICLLLNKYRISNYILILLVGAELVTSFIVATKTYTLDDFNNIYIKYYEGTIKKPDKTDFYRAETFYTVGKRPIIDDYYGIDSSTSMQYSSVYTFVHDIGLYTDNSANIFYSTGSYLSNLLLGIKYIHYKDRVLENKYYLSLLYGIDHKLDKEIRYSSNFFSLSNEIANELGNINDLYTPTTYKKKSLEYEDDDFIYYKYIYPDNTFVRINFTNVVGAENDGNNYTVYTANNNYNKKSTINVTRYGSTMIEIIGNELIVGYLKDEYDESNIVAYQLDMKKYKELYNHLNKYPAKIDYFNEDYIEVTTDFDKDLSMMSSIPYDEGWHVYIDDKEVETYSQYNTFLGFDIPKGNHKIKLKYKIPYFKESTIISISTLVLFIIFEVVKKYKKNKT